jgi:hypothetical protein
MVLGSASQPQLTPLPTSAAPSLEQELMEFVLPYTTKSYGEPPFPPPLPMDIWDDWLKENPQYDAQTMSTTDPATHHFGQSSTSNYEADLLRMREDLASMFKSKLGLCVGRSRLYQMPYVDAFDLIPYPAGWRVSSFVKFGGDYNRSTWEHISQYIAQLREAGSSKSLRVRIFSLSLTGMAFSWFSSLAPNSIRSWDELEQMFHDHFYSGDNETKLTDLTSVKQGRDESIHEYIKRFKDIKNDALISHFLKRIWSIWLLWVYVIVIERSLMVRVFIL